MVDSVLCGHYCYNTDIFLLWYPGCNVFFVNNCFFKIGIWYVIKILLPPWFAGIWNVLTKVAVCWSMLKDSHNVTTAQPHHPRIPRPPCQFSARMLQYIFSWDLCKLGFYALHSMQVQPACNVQCSCWIYILSPFTAVWRCGASVQLETRVTGWGQDMPRTWMSLAVKYLQYRQKIFPISS